MNGSLERPVLLAVANPAHVEQLVRTASDLARAVDGYVQIVSVVAKPHTSPFSVYSDEAIIENFAQDTQDVLDAAIAVVPDDVRVEREILVGRTVADGVLEAIAGSDAEMLVIGWHGRRGRTDAVLGTNLDRLITRAPCDLYVERVGYEANGVDSILLPVAGGPHVRPAAVAANAIAARNDATVHVLSVADSDDDSDTAQEYLEAAVRLMGEAPGPAVNVETERVVGEDVPDALLETAPGHDVLIFGVTRQSAIRRRLVGSIPQTVIPQTDQTVILARSGEVVSRPRLERLRRLWRHA